MFDDLDWWREEHELEARRAALNDADASTRKLVNTLPIHQIGLVATGTPETAEFKERIRASFARICSIRLSKMQ